MIICASQVPWQLPPRKPLTEMQKLLATDEEPEITNCKGMVPYVRAMIHLVNTRVRDVCCTSATNPLS